MSISATEQITVNGAQQSLESSETVLSLVNRLIGASHGGIAVALNGAVLPAGRWAKQPLATGDQIEILTAFQGG